MSWIVRSSLKFRFIVVALAAGLLVVGATQLPNSKVDVFPEFAPPKVEVQTIALGLTKQCIASSLQLSMPDAMAKELAALELSSRTADFREGLAAFKERRDPTYEGR